MINDETKRKLREMAMDPLIKALENQEVGGDTYFVMSFDERLNLAVDECYTQKHVERAKRLIQGAKFRYPNADVNTMYYENRSINRNEILTLANCSYILKNTNLIINGYTGCGKTHLACALGKEACRRLYRVRYFRMPELLEMLNIAVQTGYNLSKTVKKLANYDLLIIDEWLADNPSDQEVKYLLEIFEKRYDTRPTIFCTQRRVSDWHIRLGGGIMADAILDRIVHNSITIDTGETNMREFLAAHPALA